MLNTNLLNQDFYDKALEISITLAMIINIITTVIDRFIIRPKIFWKVLGSFKLFRELMSPVTAITKDEIIKMPTIIESVPWLRFKAVIIIENNSSASPITASLKLLLVFKFIS